MLEARALEKTVPQMWNEALLSATCFLFQQRLFRIFYNLSYRVYNKLERTIPGFNVVMEKVRADSAARDAQRKAKREAEKRAEAEEAIYGRRVTSDHPAP